MPLGVFHRRLGLDQWRLRPPIEGTFKDVGQRPYRGFSPSVQVVLLFVFEAALESSSKLDCGVAIHDCIYM